MMTQVWISGAGLFGATVFGAVLGFFIKNLPHKWNDVILGYCAGIMLAASIVGLIVPAFDMTDRWWLVATGVLAGGFFLTALDFLVPHLHTITGLATEEHHDNKTLSRILLFVMAIALHKLPEGMAAGVSMNGTATGVVDWSVSLAIALQNIPEGMVVIAPLLLAGVSKLRTFVISVSIGLLEIVGVWLGFALGVASAAFLPVMLGFAGGAMLYVTGDDMIPEAHAHGYQKPAMLTMLLGLVTMLLLEKLF